MACVPRCSWIFPLAVLAACGAEDGAPALPSIGELPIAEDLDPDPNVLEVDLQASETMVELSPGVRTAVMAYNGGRTGPLLLAHVGDRVIVHFRNDLRVPTTVHWHGLRISSDMDGSPMIQEPIPAGGSYTYDFVLPDAGTFWYHPHAFDIEQLDRGLYGAIVVTEREPPVFTAERVFMLDDIRLDEAGQIAPFNTSGHDVMMGRLGNTLLVNGQTEPLSGSVPVFSVERWRLVSSATARVLEVSVEGAGWRVIAADGGLLPEPYRTDRLVVAPGQRYDLEVLYDQDVPAARLLVHAPTANGEAAFPMAEYTMQPDLEADTPPPVYPVVTLPEIPEAPLTKELRLGATSAGFTINGAVHDTGHEHGDEAIEQFAQGVPVKLTIVNEIGPYHPFHLHGQFFQILERNGQPAGEPGLKDTVLLGSLETVTVLTYFENPGRWMYHCHIPEHAEYGMMAELEVVPAPTATEHEHH